MNQRSVVLTLAGLLVVFSACMLIAPSNADAFGKLAFGTLTALAAFIQQQPPEGRS